MDIALLISAVVTGLVSFMAGLLRTDELDDAFFAIPVLRPLRDIRKSLNNSSADKCPGCPEDFVEPYLQISFRRFQLVVNIGSVILGLFAQAIILLIYQNYTAAFSYMLWAGLPTYLVGRYIFELKDVFNYWTRPFFRSLYF